VAFVRCVRGRQFATVNERGREYYDQPDAADNNMQTKSQLVIFTRKCGAETGTSFVNLTPTHFCIHLHRHYADVKREKGEERDRVSFEETDDEFVGNSNCKLARSNHHKIKTKAKIASASSIFPFLTELQ